MTRPFRADDTVVDLIIGFEGYVDGVYADSRGLATGGYGHLLHMSAPTPADHRRYDRRGKPYWRGVLRHDIERVVMVPMRRLIHVDINQHMVAGLASATFNCGPGLLSGTVGRLINERRFRDAFDAMVDLWDNPAVLRARREQERRVALTPVEVRFPWLLEDERRWVLEYDRLKAAGRDMARRRVLQRYMRARAEGLEYAAEHEGGWGRAHRRQRWASLHART